MTVVPHYVDPAVTLYAGDCIEVMAGMTDNSVDAVVTDPPYGLEFMGKDWDKLGAVAEAFRESLDEVGKVDYHGKGNAPFGGGGHRVRYGSSARSMQAWHEAWAAECLRVLKPGGHLLAFGGTRTHHRLACAIEDAGFEIRDTITWLYGSGFPKSLDVSKAIDKVAGAEREDLGESLTHHGGGTNKVYAQDEWTKENFAKRTRLTAPATDAARQWQGWGTALKPSSEPIVTARKPLVGTVAANVQQWGTGALNIDATRVEYGNEPVPDLERWRKTTGGWKNTSTAGVVPNDNSKGRWPPNVLLDGGAAAELDRQTGVLTSGAWSGHRNGTKFGQLYGEFAGAEEAETPREGNSGGASRFFPVFRADPVCVLYGMLSGCERVSGAALKSHPIGSPPGSVPSDASAVTSPASAGRQDSSPPPAPIAAGTSPPTVTGATAAGTVPSRTTDSLVQHVLSAGILCVSCGTRIARSLAPTRSEPTTRTLGLPSTGDSDERILNRSLALIAADLARPGTTSTTTDWTTSLGCAVDAISTYTIRASQRQESKSGQPYPMRYEAKAPQVERPRIRQAGGTDNATTYGQMRKRECNVCGSRTAAAGGEQSGRPWPTCGHDDWTWVEQQSAADTYLSHPTTKPLDLMRWLVRLVTPPGGLVLDPFAGSGTTGEACVVEGFRCVLIEKDPTYLPLIVARLSKPIQPDMFGASDDLWEN